jgi:hypothetical protein
MDARVPRDRMLAAAAPATKNAGAASRDGAAGVRDRRCQPIQRRCVERERENVALTLPCPAARINAAISNVVDVAGTTIKKKDPLRRGMRCARRRA